MRLCARRNALRVAARPIPGVGAHGRGNGARGGAGGDGATAVVRLHAFDRPSLRLSPRPPTHLRGARWGRKRSRPPLPPRPLLEVSGWEGDDVWYAHGIRLNDAEVDRIAEVNTGIAHCPSSNMRLGAGACRVEDLLRVGARVGLGVDGSASNEDANLALEAHQALLLARVRNASPSALDARLAWR